jgi:transposase
MLQTINPHAAAIDVGSEQLHVAVGNQPVQVFDTFTESLHALRDMLVTAGLTTVAMEATGVYWLPVYEVLETGGVEICGVNGAHVKSRPGRKSDMQDCQWLAELHSHGLLRSGVVPPQAIRRLRDYQRLRRDHIRLGSAHIQHMQKALDRMNEKIHEVLSDLTGVGGLRLVRAILDGVRSRHLLLEMCAVQIVRRKRAAMLKALEGNCRDVGRECGQERTQQGGLARTDIAGDADEAARLGETEPEMGQRRRQCRACRMAMLFCRQPAPCPRRICPQWGEEPQWVGSATRINYVGGLYYYGEYSAQDQRPDVLLGVERSAVPHGGDHAVVLASCAVRFQQPGKMCKDYPQTSRAAGH